MNTFTVRQALNLPVFATSQLVAGTQGLDNVIHWVHIVDLKNAQYQWQRRGVLLMTSGLGFYEDPDHQKILVKELVKFGFAGLVLSTGYYFEHIPEVIRQDADRLGLPIIETPPDLLFIQITEVVLGRIINQNYAVLQQCARINQQLTYLVLRGASLEDLATTLASFLQQSIVIESPAFQIITASQVGSVDLMWTEQITRQRSQVEIIDQLVRANVYEALQTTLKPQLLAPRLDESENLARLVAPIEIDQDIYGYLWLIGLPPFSALSEQVLTHGATVAGLMLAKIQAVRSAEATQQGDFLTQLLDARSPQELQEQAQCLNYHLNAAHQVLLIRFVDPAHERIQPLQTSVQQLLKQGYPFSLLARRENAVIVVLESDQPAQSQQFADQVLAALDDREQPLVVGMGTICLADAPCGSLRQSYQQAQEAAHIGVLMQRRGAIAFSELGILHWLYHLSPDHRAGNTYLQHVYHLSDYDTQRGTQLLATLEMYLDRGNAVAEAAEALYIHRNTLLNRLERIESLCQLSLRNSTHCLNLNIAIKSYRLHD